MANYLRRLGIDAVPSNMNNYYTLMPQVVLDAGMGELSRMGIILNPFLGCNCKYAAVLTNLELEVDGYVDFGLQKYCAQVHHLRGPVPVAVHQARSEDPLQRLLHLEARLADLLRLRRPQQGGLRLRPLHQGVPVEPAGHGASRLGGMGRQPGVAA